jgi:hypothetical protein
MNRFLSSDMITLSTEDSTRTFKIHKALFESKCMWFNKLEVLKKGTENTYKFLGTPESILVRLIVWAYTGEYPEKVSNVDSKSAIVMKSSSIDETITADDDPLSCHMQMYIFAHVHGIWRLKWKSYDRIKESLRKIGKPTVGELKLKVISMMEMGFKKIHGNDNLLSWFGHYALFYLDELRETPAFQKLLEEAPHLSLAMLKYLNSGLVAPLDLHHPAISLLSWVPPERLRPPRFPS